MNTRIGVHQLRLQRAKAKTKKQNCVKNKYTIKYCCPKNTVTSTTSTTTGQQNCTTVLCGERTIYFRQIAPTGSDTAADGDVWFNCSQNPSTQYVYKNNLILASDANGNLYSVNIINGSGTQISTFTAPYDSTSNPIYYPPYSNCDVLIDPLTTNGYVFGLPNIAPPPTAIITEFNTSTLALTGRTGNVPYPPGILTVRILFISAATYVKGKLIINVFLQNHASTVFSNHLYQIDPENTNLSLIYLGTITSGILFLSDYVITGLAYDDETDILYAVTNYNDENISYNSGRLYTINLTTYEATLLYSLTFPPELPPSDFPVAQSLTKFNSIYYLGMCSKLPVSPTNNFAYLLKLDIATGFLTLVDPTLTNTVVPNNINGGVVGLTSRGGWQKVSLPT